MAVEHVGFSVEGLEVLDVQGEPLAGRLGVQVGLRDQLRCMLFPLGHDSPSICGALPIVVPPSPALEVAPIASLQEHGHSVGIIARVTPKLDASRNGIGAAYVRTKY